MATVTIENSGAVESIEFQTPEGGGLILLRGANGTGKSHGLDTVKRLLGGDERPTVHDGADKGTAEGWGARINIGPRITKSGHLDVQSIEGKLDLAAFIDPGIDDPASADAKRIKSLLVILDVTGDAALFTPRLIPTPVFESLAVEPSEDLVEYAGRVKRKLEQGARDNAARAVAHHQKATGLMANATEFGPEQERDSATLQSELEASISEKSRLDQQVKDYSATLRIRADAKAKLDNLPEPMVDLVSAEGNLVAATRVREAANAELEEAKRKVASATERYNVATHQEQLADQALMAAQRNASMRDSFEAILSANPPVAVSEASIAAANATVESARSALELGVKAREYDKAKALADTERQQGKAADEIADLFRSAALGIDSVLSDAVGGLDIGLFVEKGLLRVKTDRGAEPIGELSHGERVKLGVRLVASRVGAGGVVVVDQEDWESLDPTNTQEIVAFAHETGVVILSAEASDGPLRAEVY